MSILTMMEAKIMRTFMRLMHELEKLIDNGLQELPMSLEETRVLSDNVHDVGCNDGLVVFASFNLTKSKEILDNRDKEALLGFLVFETTSASASGSYQ